MNDADKPARTLNHCFVVRNKHWEERIEQGLLWAGGDGVTKVHEIPENATLLDCLVTAGLFPSKGQARKNWKHPIALRVGYSEFENLGKFHTNLYIWVPFHDPDCPCGEAA